MVFTHNKFGIKVSIFALLKVSLFHRQKTRKNKCRIILLPLLVLPPARPGPRPRPPGPQEQLVAPHPVEVAHGDPGEGHRGLRLQHGGRHHGVVKDLADDDAKGLRRQGQAGNEQGEPESI